MLSNKERQLYYKLYQQQYFTQLEAFDYLKEKPKIQKESQQLDIYIPIGFQQQQQPQSIPKIKRYQEKEAKYVEEFPADYLDYIPLPNQEKQIRILPKYHIPDESENNTIDRSQIRQFQESFQSNSSSHLTSYQTMTQRSIKVQPKRSNNSKTKILRIKKKSKQLAQFNEIGKSTLQKLKVKMINSIKLDDLLNRKEEFSLGNKNEVKKYLQQIVKDLKKNFIFGDDDEIQLINQFIQYNKFAIKQYYFKLEAKRLSLTSFQTLRKLDDNQQKMVLICLLLVRVLTFQCIYQAYILKQKLEQNILLIIKRNSIILASILHNILSEWIIDNVKERRGNEQIVPREYPLSDDMENLIKSGKVNEDHKLIDGLLSDLMIRKYTTNNQDKREEWVDKLQKDLIDWIEPIKQKLNDYEYNLVGEKERLVWKMYYQYRRGIKRR